MIATRLSVLSLFIPPIVIDRSSIVKKNVQFENWVLFPGPLSGIPLTVCAPVEYTRVQMDIKPMPPGTGLVMAAKPRFQIHMKAAGLGPETVRASDLAVVLINLEGAIVETAKAQDIPLAYEPDEVLVSLVQVELGASNDLTIAVARPISPAASTVSEAVAKRRFDILPIQAQSHLYELSKHAIQNRWAYEFKSVNGLTIAPAVISYEFPVPKPSEVATTSGQATLWGNLFKVGGDVPRAVLRLRNGRLFAAKVTKEIVDFIQSRHLIYKDIGLIGTATWRLDNWSMESFQASSVTDYRPDEISPAETFRRLREASQGRWDDVDPEQFVNDLRSEGE